MGGLAAQLEFMIGHVASESQAMGEVAVWGAGTRRLAIRGSGHRVRHDSM